MSPLRDAASRERLAFWGLAATVVFFAAVPSLVMIEKGAGYYRFLTGWEPEALKKMTVDYVPHADTLDSAELPDLEFVEFSFSDSKAKDVRVAGDFNGWRGDGYPMVKKGKSWSLVIPLPPGRYRYGFFVDGIWTADSQAASAETKDGRTLSILDVSR